MNLTKYKSKFIAHERLLVGRGSRIRILGLECKKLNRATARGDDYPVEIRATVEIEFSPTIAVERCDICGTQTPPPDDDALFYLLENHDHDRIVFPAPETKHDRPDRDSWPVAGWKKKGDGLMCGECAREGIRLNPRS